MIGDEPIFPIVDEGEKLSDRYKDTTSTRRIVRTHDATRLPSPHQAQGPTAPRNSDKLVVQPRRHQRCQSDAVLRLERSSRRCFCVRHREISRDAWDYPGELLGSSLALQRGQILTGLRILLDCRSAILYGARLFLHQSTVCCLGTTTKSTK